MSYQKVMLIGNVGVDPEVKYIDQNSVVANFTLAVTERWKGRGGEQTTHTEWFKMVCWGNTAKLVEEYLSKGDKIFVECKKRERSYESNGQQRYVTEFLIDQMRMLSRKSDRQQPEATETKPQPSQPEPEKTPAQGTFDNFDNDNGGPDDLPF